MLYKGKCKVTIKGLKFDYGGNHTTMKPEAMLAQQIEEAILNHVGSGDDKPRIKVRKVRVKLMKLSAERLPEKVKRQARS